VGLRIEICPVGQRMAAGDRRTMAGLAAAGNHLLVDEVLLDASWLRDWVTVLALFPVLFVRVRCPLHEVDRRERGDRAVGQALGYFDAVHAHGLYDLEVDTSRAGTAACAAQIIAVPRPLFAFARTQGEVAALAPQKHAGGGQ